MIKRILPLALFAALLLGLGLQATQGTAAPKKKGFVTLKSLKKDFIVAVGEAELARELRPDRGMCGVADRAEYLFF